MDEKQRERIIKRHTHSIYLYGDTPQALYWGNRQVQQLRFDVLLSCGVKSGDTVLDVGSGFADLYPYMCDKGLEVDYTGIDLSPDMVEKSKQKYPHLCFFNGDLFDFNPRQESYDWVLLSGALNEPLQDDGEYLGRMLPRLYSCCRQGLAFNLLNADFAWQPKDAYTLQSYQSDDVMKALGLLSRHTALRSDYLAQDVSYFVWRDEQYSPSK